MRALNTRADLMPVVTTLWLVDPGGRLLSASEATPAPEPSMFSPGLETLPDESISVSRAFEDAQTKETRIALAVRFDDGAGHFGGWIMAALPARSLLGAFAATPFAADARMAVFRSDGARLTGSIVATPSLDEASVAHRLATQRSIELRRFRDGSEHLVGLHSLPRYGLKVLLTRDVEVVLGAWREMAQLTAATVLVVLCITFLAIFLLLRADRRHALAQLALQAQLARTSKLESLGTLAGSVAHDFNNVLAAIVGYGEMAQDAAPSGSHQARHLERVLQAALRGKSLVERILAFSRGGARKTLVFEIEPLVDEVLTLLATSLRPGVVLERELDALGARLRGDPTQAFEAIMNLCTNAMQAMPDGGVVTLQAARLKVAAPRVLSHSQLRPGNYLSLSVADQGTGITPDAMEHLFEPFFTTRAAQSGTGLGLAVVHGVVAELDGAIDVQSTPGKGACFTLYFPECLQELAQASPQASTELVGAGQCLLVLDDEPTLVALAEEMLQSLGYAPEGFTDPQAALQALKAQPARFAAVITDEAMAGLTGTQLTVALRKFAPSLPVLLVSGYGGALLAARAAAAGVTRVLAKPLARGELARVLAELLR
jgi:signal transduction histidine kinase